MNKIMLAPAKHVNRCASEAILKRASNGFLALIILRFEAIHKFSNDITKNVSFKKLFFPLEIQELYKNQNEAVFILMSSNF